MKPSRRDFLKLPSNIIKYSDLIYHTHIAEKTGRSAPGVHNEDFTPYFRALKQVNYLGRMAIECSWNNLEEQAYGALSVMRSQIGSV
jgi:sugar phosphate isomerase/epimerase